MDVFDEEFELMPAIDAPDEGHDERHKTPDLYKKWFRTRERAGFLTVRPWFDANKCSVDIGEVNPTTNRVTTNTLAWTDLLALGTYLRAVTNGTAARIYPRNPTAGLPCDGGFVSYGGGQVDGKPISRILKIHGWQNGEIYADNAFAWKCGHFAARKTGSGAYIPDMKAPLGQNLIKVTLAEMAEISYRFDVATFGHAAHDPEWFAKIKK